MGRKSSAGGAAGTGGSRFEARVGAWYAAQIVAEDAAPALQQAPIGARVTFIRAQTGEEADDLLAGFSNGGHHFIQAKNSLSLEQTETSELASAIDQFVRQFVAGNSSDAVRPWDRPLDAARDRLLFIIGSDSSRPLREDARRVINRMRDLAPGQPLTDAAVNENEEHALGILRAHASRSWRAATGTDPSDADLQAFFACLAIEVLAIEPDGANEREARGLLRASVLADASQEVTAWTTLRDLMGQTAEDRTGVSRSRVEEELRRAGVRLQGVRSYAADIERLIAHMADSLRLLAPFASFESNGTTVMLPREVAAPLRDAAEAQSVVVVGDPGAGKSGALHALVSQLRDAGGTVLLLAAVDIAATSLGELRAELGLTHDVVDVLANWRQAKMGVLVIDGLDAARAEPVSRTLRNLIRLVRERAPNWRVVASIRVFDLRHGAEIQELFRGTPHAATPAEMRRSEFARLAHFHVPALTDSELAALGERAAALAPLIASAPADLRMLLRVPFNVQLLAQLLDDGAPLSALQPLRTQGELLDLYWQRRVRVDARGDARETILRSLAQAMVDTRQLRADRRTLALDSSGSVLLSDLLSSHVLSEADRAGAFVSFSHHVLFDYAVARLVLPATASELVAYIASDPALLLVVRPSLVMLFESLWRNDRQAFWDTAIGVVAAPEIPAIGEIIGPTVAVDLARDVTDFDAGFAQLRDGPYDRRNAAEGTLRYVVGALLSASTRPLVGDDAGPWAAFVARLAAERVPASAYAVRALLTAVTERPDRLTAEQMTAAGSGARNLLDFAQVERSGDRALIQAALTLVARTVASDATAAVASMQPCLASQRIASVGYQEIPALAREAKRIAAAAPDFAVELYATAFGHTETSDERTEMGSSVLLPLTSNRQQDYRMALYSLAEAYPAFLVRSPIVGTKALIRAIAGFVAREHPPRSGEIREDRFLVGETTAIIQTDYSAIWDRDGHDDALTLLRVFEERLCALADAGETTTLEQIIAIVVTENRTAALWRRLLRAGVARPAVLGPMLAPLFNRAVLTAFDTATVAAELLVALFPTLDVKTRGRLERIVLQLADDGLGNTGRDPAKLRDGILRNLDLADLTTEEARGAAAALRAKTAVQPALPRDDDEFTFEGGAMSEEETLAFNGVDLAAAANRRIRDLTVAVEQFVRTHNGSDPSQEQIAAVMPDLEALLAALATAEEDGVHAHLRRSGEIIVAETAATIPKCRTFTRDDPALLLARRLLDAAATSAFPILEEQFEAQWNERETGWGPAERIEAAQGFLYIVRREETFDDDALAQIERLSLDPVAAVRFQVATRLVLLYKTAPATMWHLLEKGVRTEQRAGVAMGFLDTLNRLQPIDPPRVTNLLLELLARFPGDAGKRLRELSTKILTALAIWRDVPAAREYVATAIAHTAEDPDTAGDILGVIREPLGLDVDDGVPDAADVRARAVAITDALLKAAIDAYRDAAPGGVVPHPLEKQEEERLRHIVGIIDGVARELYFASGAHDADDNAPAPLDPERARRFYDACAALIERLIPVGLAPATHAVLETLEALVAADPTRIFRQVRALVEAGRMGGYLGESSALRLVVRIIERYLADYRYLFQTDVALRQDLIDILNLFIEAGWPEALRFAARLDEIFR